MKRMLFVNMEKLTDKILDIFDSNEENEDFYGVSVVGHYDIIANFLNYISKNTNFEMYDISLAPSEVNGYYDEYILSIDPDGLVWCQEAKHEDRYLETEKEVIFVHSDTNSKFVIRNKDNEMIEFCFDNEFECNGECIDCIRECDTDEFDCDSNLEDSELEPSNSELTAIVDDEDNLHGFTYSSSEDGLYRSVSYYTTENLENDLLKDLFRIFRI